MRTGLLFAFAVAGVVLTARSPALATHPDDEWPMYRGNPARTGSAGWSGVGTGDVLWSFPTDSIGVRTSPPVANGTVYFGDQAGVFYAVDALTGELRWKFQGARGAEREYEFFGSAAVSGGRVYVGSGDWHVYAFDEGSGEVLWSYETDGSVWSSVAVANDTVIGGSRTGTVYALDADTGVPLWTRPAADKDLHEGVGSALVVGDTVYIVTAGRVLRALAVKTGSERWSHEVRFGFSDAPSWGGRLVLIPVGDGRLQALDPYSGLLVWERDIGEAASLMAVSGELAYLVAGGGLVACIETSSGSSVWERREEAGLDGPPAVAGGVLYVTDSGGGGVWALNASTGEVVWKNRFTHIASGNPAVVDGILYVGSETFGNARLFALDAGIGLNGTGVPAPPVPPPAPRPDDGAADPRGTPFVSAAVVAALCIAVAAGLCPRRNRGA